MNINGRTSSILKNIDCFLFKQLRETYMKYLNTNYFVAWFKLSLSLKLDEFSVVVSLKKSPEINTNNFPFTFGMINDSKTFWTSMQIRVRIKSFQPDITNNQIICNWFACCLYCECNSFVIESLVLLVVEFQNENSRYLSTSHIH